LETGTTAGEYLHSIPDTAQAEMGSPWNPKNSGVLVREDAYNQGRVEIEGEKPMTLDYFNLSGKVALVTGGSKGLGKAMARALAEAGADVVISARHEEELKAGLDEILKGTGRKGRYFVSDMSRREEPARLARAALDAMGRVDILINNAGTNKPQAIDEISDETWDQVLQINLTSVMSLTRALAPQMKQHRWGRIIHIASIMAFLSKEKRNVYSATKSALLGLARASAIDLGPFGITVNCIAPGPFLTDLPASVLSKAEQQAFADHTAVGRWGEPRELAGTALLLASDAGSYITGQTIIVDGGYMVR
jgi:NAD(P)-dependent dehydrogenase (short-subunit alcohol dehydrogenase family)